MGFFSTLMGGGGDAGDAKKLITEGALVLDVRTREEWNGGHVASAKLLPVQELPTRLREVESWVAGDKSKPIVVYCRSGARSSQAREILQRAGFTHVVNGGGYGALR